MRNLRERPVKQVRRGAEAAKKAHEESVGGTPQMAPVPRSYPAATELFCLREEGGRRKRCGNARPPVSCRRATTRSPGHDRL